MTRGRGRGGRVGDSEQGAGDAVGNMNAQVPSSAEDTVDGGAKKSIMDRIATRQLKMASTSVVTNYNLNSTFRTWGENLYDYGVNQHTGNRPGR
jgi:hypothetical protein